MADLQGGSQQIDGETPHDNADAGNPVKIGGTATAALPTAVGEGDRVQASFNLDGEQRIVATGNVAHDAVDSGNPIKIGGRARSTAPATVSNDDRVDAVYTPTGAAQIAGISVPGVITPIKVASSDGDVAIAGNEPHDQPDSSNPVKIGGHGSASLRTAVAEADRVDASFDLEGRQRVRSEGNINHDAPDSGFPFKAGGHATAAPRTAVDEDDRVDASFDLAGRQRSVATGNVAHSGIDSGNPIKIGGRARGTAIANVSTDDRVDWIFTPGGAGLIAGATGAGVPIPIQVNTVGQTIIDGNAVHNGVDLGNSVKIGSFASAALRTSVTEGDRVEMSVDLEGRQRNTVEGSEAHDSADAGLPVKTGGRARTTAIAAVATDDRVDQIMTTTGGLLTAGQDGGVPRDLAVNASGQLEVDIAAQQGSALTIQGDVAADDADAGNPVKIGFQAAEFNADPPQVSADSDRVNSIATPQGIQYTLGGHPNQISREYMTTGAQTNDPIIDTVAAGSQIILLGIEVLTSAAGSTTPQVRIGFGTTAVPTEPTSGNTVDGIPISHPGIAAGSGVVKGYAGGIVAEGGDGEELRITCDVPTGGQITVLVTYYVSSL